METIFWEVDYVSPPKIIRHCKKCGTKTEYVSSGMFRVNAQQKLLDVWLVYRCASCKTTWNLPIFRRISPAGIGRELLDKFLGNDGELALKYAMDTDLLERNGAAVMPLDYRIVGDEVDFSRDVRLVIASRSPCKIKVSQLLREKLCLSNRVFDKMVSSGRVRMENGAGINRCKLHDSAIVLFGGSLACPDEANISAAK